jgi:glycosyltransferase involved in cell wall biosynthesis
MRVGFDVAQTCVERAGCALYADSLARALVKAAPEVNFDLYHHFGGWINSATTNGTMIDSPNVGAPFANFSSGEASRFWRGEADFSKISTRPDIVHSCSYQAPKMKATRLVFTVHDVCFWTVPQYTTEINRLVCQEGTLAALKRADGFIFVSNCSLNEFERIFPRWLEVNRKPFAVTPLGPRSAPSPNLDVAVGEFWLAVGSLEPRKNYEGLLDAFELYWKLSKSPAPLKIAGGAGWQSAALKNRINQLSRNGLVNYLGYVPDDALTALYARARALIFTSWHEGFGLPVVEAMAQGCPVISSDRASLPEVGGDAPIYVDPAHPVETTRAMIRLESEPGLRNLKAKASVRRARQFSWERTAELTLKLYREVLR